MENYIKDYLIKVTVMIIIALYFTGCDDGGGSSSAADLSRTCDERLDLEGRWVTPEGETLDLSAMNCQAVQSSCSLTFAWNAPSDGQVLINVTATSQAPGCPQQTGEIVCRTREGVLKDDQGAFEYLGVDCGQGFITYYRSL